MARSGTSRVTTLSSCCAGSIPAVLAACASDSGFLRRYDEVMARMAHETSSGDTWFAANHPESNGRPVAYFCAEFGLHNSVPIYSGGLGVLAGDHCKASSDLGVPLVGVGIFYIKGYFDQRLRLDGWQQDSDEEFDTSLTPLVPISGTSKAGYLATVETSGRPVHVGAWRIMVGRVPIYLLDTNLEVNHPDDRGLMNKLYAGGPDLRLRQEWILGVGGVRVLRALGVDPGVWHANEGHAAFMLIERLREYIVQGMSYADAVREVRARSVFTTHTPVPAGHDSFSVDQLEAVAGPVWKEMGIDRDTFFGLGAHPGAARPLPHDRDRHAALGSSERRLTAPWPGIAEPVARAVAREALGDRADRPCDERRSPRHLDGEPDHGAARCAPRTRMGRPARRAADSGIRC